MASTLHDLIASVSTFNNDDTIFAKKIDGKFLENSEALVVQLTEEESGLRTKEIAERKCPGYEYFLEIFIIKELIEDLDDLNNVASLEEKIAIIIYYAEYDAYP